MNGSRILIAGIGNIFLGDDAFGVEVAQRLLRRPLPACVRVADFGIRGHDLAYAMMGDFDTVILVDATSRAGAPGTLYMIEPDLNPAEGQAAGSVEMDTHGMNPMRVLEFVRAMGGAMPRVLIVGCEPATLGEQGEGKMGLSAPVEASLDRAIAMIESLVASLVQADRAAVT
jgi:hydrogenase maturation protease